MKAFVLKSVLRLIEGFDLFAFHNCVSTFETSQFRANWSC